jgi:hypothetical protein
LPYARGDFVQVIYAERHLHPAFRAELVDEKGNAICSFYVFKKQGGAARTPISPGCSLGDTVRDLRDLQHGIDLGANAFELAGTIKGRDPLSKVIKCQRKLLGKK